MAKTKKAAAKSNRLSLGLKCGDCLHFKTGPKSPAYAKRCSELGTKSFARACDFFTANFSALNRRDGSLSAAAKIAKAAASLSTSNTRILAQLLSRQSVFEKVGVRFGEPMYLFLEPTVGLARSGLEALKGENFQYLENYYKAYVIGVTDLGDGVREVFLASAVEGKPDYYVSVNVKEGEKFKRALTQTEFEKLEAKLKADGKKKMPKMLRKRLEKLHELKLLPPADDEPVRTLDDVPLDWWTSTSHAADEGRAKRNKGVRLQGKGSKFRPDSVDRELAGKSKIKPKGSIRVRLIGDEEEAPSKLSRAGKLKKQAKRDMAKLLPKKGKKISLAGKKKTKKTELKVKSKKPSKR